MRSAVWPRDERTETRLLRIDPMHGSLDDRRVRDLPALLRPDDLVVVNDAATVPAALLGRTRHGPMEIRLAGPGPTARDWRAVLFGAGTWRQRTEDRPAPPMLGAEEAIEFAGGLQATITRVSQISPRLVQLRFDRDGAALWAALYGAGRPVQYSYLRDALELWHVQTAYAGRPWAVEMPSAGWAVTAGIVRELQRRGIAVATITHAAGLSATGDPALDAALPLPERYEIPSATVDAVARAHDAGGRIVAVGTTVVRAMEGAAAANHGQLRAGAGETDLRVHAAFTPRIVNGLLTGIHMPGTSHFELLRAFAPEAVLLAATRHAEDAGYLQHEFGDTSLVLAAA